MQDAKKNTILPQIKSVKKQQINLQKFDYYSKDSPHFDKQINSKDHKQQKNKLNKIKSTLNNPNYINAQTNIFRLSKIKFYKKVIKIAYKQYKQSEIKMEEKPTTDAPTLQTSSSDWRIKHNLYQTYRNHRQLQNRISILELQKKKKLKDIENKLNQHKKFVQSKIYKYQLKQAIGNKVNTQLQRSSSNSRVFKAQRQSRSLNIRRQQDDLFMTRHKMFQQTKQSRIENQKKILLNKLAHLEEKVKKRNRVRLIEIESKENIESYWNNRLQAFQEDKRMDMTMKLKQQEDKMRQLQEMEKSQESLLEEIRKAEQVEMDLSRMIQAQKTLPGGKLNDLYASKVSNTAADENQ